MLEGTRAIDELIDDGRFVEALDELTARNLAHRDPDVEVLLASLRRDAYAEFEHLPETPALPGELPDPFPDTEGLPEIGVSDLTPEVLAGALRYHGVLMVRGLIDAGAAEELAAGVDQAFDQQQQWRDDPERELTSWFVPLDNHPRYPLKPNAALGRQWPRFNRVLAVDSPRLLFDLFRAWTDVHLDEILRVYFGARPVLGENKFCFRRMPYRESVFGEDWHQEASVFDVDRELHAVNLWMALTPCGENAPAIEFIPASVDTVVATERAYGVAPATAAKVTNGRPPASPIFEPGDGVLFNELTFHRTNAHEGMGDIRKNVEAWFFAPWGHPGHNGRVVY